MDRLKKVYDEILPYVLIVIIVVTIRSFIITPVRVDGASMEPTLKNGQILLLSKLSDNYKRFDIVVVQANDTKIVKRIIALPGETIQYKNNKLYINGKKMNDSVNIHIPDFDLEKLYSISVLPNNYYFVMGDNRNNSSDSRDYRIGLINKKQIVGKPVFRIWPITKIGVLKK